jgi:uncharacterized protein (TIGR00725 family)
MLRPPIIGVIGGGAGTAPPGSETYVLAESVGRLLARSGALVLCGGRGGVMEAAAKGAREGGGRTIGVLPTLEGEANAYIDCALYTGLGDGRNYVNARTSDALIALAGEAGTLSEIALGLKIGVPVVYLKAWEFLQAQPAFAADWAATPDEAIAIAFRRAGAEPGGLLDRPLRYPALPDQAAQRKALEDFLACLA